MYDSDIKELFIEFNNLTSVLRFPTNNKRSPTQID